MITLDSARLLEKEYVDTRYRVINESLGYDDTREFWVSIDFLENYIAYVKEESKKSGYENLGIRIYNYRLSQKRNRPKNPTRIFNSGTCTYLSNTRYGQWHFAHGANQSKCIKFISRELYWRRDTP